MSNQLCWNQDTLSCSRFLFNEERKCYTWPNAKPNCYSNDQKCCFYCCFLWQHMLMVKAFLLTWVPWIFRMVIFYTAINTYLLPHIYLLPPQIMIFKTSLPLLCSSKPHKYGNYDKVPYIVSFYPQSPLGKPLWLVIHMPSRPVELPHLSRHTKKNLLKCTFSKSLTHN